MTQNLSRCEEFVADDVTHVSSNKTRPMLIKEYRNVGHGVFGTVVQAYFTPDRELWYGPFAVKRVLAQTEYKSRELDVLKLINNHPNLIKLKYYFTHVSVSDNKLYQYLAMEYLPGTLQMEINRYSSNHLTLPLRHIQLYSYQLARAMMYLHSLGICHRDIKPSNILIDSTTGVLKICDFGSAKRLEPNCPSISYICSRFYRPPELIIGSTNYTTQIDIWSLGCVIGEMILNKPLFQGQEPLLQFKEITKLLGPPDKRFIFKSNSAYDGPLFSKPMFQGSVESRFRSIFKNSVSPDGIDLLTKVLVYEPKQRLLPKYILAHDFFNDLRSNNKFIPRGQTDLHNLPKLFDFSEPELRIIGNELLEKILPNTKSIMKSPARSIKRQSRELYETTSGNINTTPVIIKSNTHIQSPKIIQ
ncbi:hypothetical protein TBLA_0B08650 [Henningerozyma blattae CBS 6284]|uniref:Protein kinase domain-containing protein n=1 Tax=Henningerozyma blattae (strain ATCC 34711 / CBS 6284 / DSM 70876 / NBRC 10599 / NRRL Y-10934 / UCD 77-7) TaxID=1071380 RepID=I2GZX8_HENB6|nr:hypothetical protein TBLA_0B08650 [Tetrapisispora blattae CBS 6284]CCH59680.1 hypothetical protein TBLA_0B08650 [Tetrapisispora blattae CBS 6284]